MQKVLRFMADEGGASAADYVIVLGGLCVALVAAGVFLDDNTQAQLQGYLQGVFGMNR